MGKSSFDSARQETSADRQEPVLNFLIQKLSMPGLRALFALNVILYQVNLRAVFRELLINLFINALPLFLEDHDLQEY